MLDDNSDAVSWYWSAPIEVSEGERLCLQADTLRQHHHTGPLGYAAVWARFFDHPSARKSDRVYQDANGNNIDILTFDDNRDAPQGVWVPIEQEFTVPPSLGLRAIRVYLSAHSTSRGRFYFDNVSLSRGGCSRVPALASDPGASHVLLLDFGDFNQPRRLCEKDGVFFVANPAETVDGVSSIVREDFVRDIFEVVAEDFAPFHVNVTTVEPTDPRFADDTGRLVRVQIGRIASRDIGGYAPPDVCGDGQGVYRNSHVRNVAFVAYNNAMSAKRLGTTATHEAGHIYGLDHMDFMVDSFSPAIMDSTRGDGDRSVWAQGTNDFGQTQDDIAILSALLGLRTDDHGSTPASATTVAQQQGPGWIETPRVYKHGVIENPLDQDLLTFRVTQGGTVNIAVFAGGHYDVDSPILEPAPEANLSIELEIRSGDNSEHIARQGSRIRPSAFQRISLNAIEPNGFYLWEPGQPKPLLTGEHYQLVVRSRGRYEDVGRYTVIVDGPVADLSGPRVYKVDRGCTRGNSEQIRLHFDQPISVPPPYFALTFADLITFSGEPYPLLEIARVPAHDPTPSTFDLIFPATGVPDTLGIEIDAQSVWGYGLDPMNLPYWLDQDNDGQNGEPADAFLRPASLIGQLPGPCS